MPFYFATPRVGAQQAQRRSDKRSEDYNRTEPTGLEYLTTTQKSTSRTVLESRLHLVYMSAFVNKMTGRTDVAMRDTTETSSYQCPRVANTDLPIRLPGVCLAFTDDNFIGAAQEVLDPSLPKC